MKYTCLFLQWENFPMCEMIGGHFTSIISIRQEFIQHIHEFILDFLIVKE